LTESQECFFGFPALQQRPFRQSLAKRRHWRTGELHQMLHYGLKPKGERRSFVLPISSFCETNVDERIIADWRDT
jgi:hypothetical protein